MSSGQRRLRPVARDACGRRRARLVFLLDYNDRGQLAASGHAVACKTAAQVAEHYGARQTAAGSCGFWGFYLCAAVTVESAEAEVQAEAAAAMWAGGDTGSSLTRV